VAKVLSEEHKAKLAKSKIGKRNPMWKDDVGYFGLHKWARRWIRKPDICSNCGITTETLDLANISQEYKRDVNDWEWLCRSCHMGKDGRLNNLKHYHCVMCGEKITYIKPYGFVCTNPACPNYGLVQLGIERMPDESRPGTLRPLKAKA